MEVKALLMYAMFEFRMAAKDAKRSKVSKSGVLSKHKFLRKIKELPWKLNKYKKCHNLKKHFAFSFSEGNISFFQEEHLFSQSFFKKYFTNFNHSFKINTKLYHWRICNSVTVSNWLYLLYSKYISVCMKYIKHNVKESCVI